MDKALRYELNKIPEINKKIYPTNAPVNKTAPFLVYLRPNYNPIKTFDGATKSVEVTYVLNVFSKTYASMDSLTKKVKDQILTFPLRTIGIENIYIQDLTINNIDGTYENELKLHRGIIDVDITYREE